MSEKQRKRLQYLLRYQEWVAVNAEQYLLGKDLQDAEWLKAHSFDEVAEAVRRARALTGEFNAQWDAVIADESGWLFDTAMLAREVESLWQDLYSRLRQSVEMHVDSGADFAFAAKSAEMIEAAGKKESRAFLEQLLKAHPDLDLYIKPEIGKLDGSEQKEIVGNFSFNDGKQEGEYPKLDDWLLYQEFGSMKGSKNNYRWEKVGHDGSYAIGLGSGDFAELRASVKMEKGSRYRLTVWYKTENVEKEPKIQWFYHKGPVEDLANIEPREELLPSLRVAMPITDGEWQRYTATFQATYDGEYVMQPWAGRQALGQMVWYDSISIKKLY